MITARDIDILRIETLVRVSRFYYRATCTRVQRFLRQSWRLCKDLWYWDTLSPLDEYVMRENRLSEHQWRQLKRQAARGRKVLFRGGIALEKKGEVPVFSPGISAIIDFPRLARLESNSCRNSQKN